MTTALHLLLAIAGFALLSLRPLWLCPSARTPRQHWAAARRRPGRTALVAARLLLVLTLLLLVETCRMVWAAARAAAWLLAALAYGIEILAGPAPLEAS